MHWLRLKSKPVIQVPNSFKKRGFLKAGRGADEYWNFKSFGLKLRHWANNMIDYVDASARNGCPIMLPKFVWVPKYYLARFRPKPSALTKHFHSRIPGYIYQHSPVSLQVQGDHNYIVSGSPWENGYCESFNDR